MVAIPFCGHVIAAGAIYAVVGASTNVLLGVGVPVMVSLWGKKVGSPLLAINTLSSIGQLVSPLIAAPFLDPDLQNSTAVGIEQPSNQSHTLVYVPFTIAGATNILPGLFFMVFFVHGTNSTAMANVGKTKHSSLREYFRNEKANGRLGAVITFLFVYFFTMTAGYARLTSASQYIVAVAVNTKLLSKESSELLLTAYMLGGTVSSFVFMFLLKILKDKWVVFGPAFISTACLGVLYFFGFDSIVLFWVLTCSVSFFLKPFRGAIIGYVNTFLEVTPFIMTINNLGVGAGGFLAHWMAGFLIETYGGKAVILATFIYSCSVCALIVCMQTIMHLKREPAESESKEI